MFLKIGYARVSTGLQNLDLQEDSLKKFGCEKIFTDYMSGVKTNRPGLETAIDFVRSGDTLVVWRWDRLGRNMEDLISIVNRLNERGVSFHSLQENITMDKSSSTGQLMFLNKYKLGIQYALKTRYSNGVLEGTNNKIKVIKRVAYGYRNFHNFRARIYLIQGLIFQVKQKPVKHSA